MKYVFGAAGKPLGSTPNWKPGKLVKDNDIAAGTAIATFKDDAYKGHSAVFMYKTKDGIRVYDQWQGQPWHSRIIRNNGKGVNNAKLYRVIEKKKNSE